MLYRLFLFGLIFISCHSFKKGSSTIYLAGDSTMANKMEARRPETGWGEKLSSFFTPGIRIENHARNGRSSKSFINEGRWDSLYQKLHKGDYVFIQFGHNDSSKSKGERYSTPSEYGGNLRKYVKDTRSKMAVPVLLTPVVRRRFDEQNKFFDTHGAYPEIVRKVAEELDVPLIDMQKMTEKMVIDYGVEASKNLFLWVPEEHKNYPDGVQDNTHFSPEGAELVAELAARGINQEKLKIRRYLKK